LRNCKKHESEYHEDEEDDLIVTSMHDRIENMKKMSDKYKEEQLGGKEQ
jgi:hypothetical protein